MFRGEPERVNKSSGIQTAVGKLKNEAEEDYILCGVSKGDMQLLWCVCGFFLLLVHCLCCIFNTTGGKLPETREPRCRAHSAPMYHSVTNTQTHLSIRLGGRRERQRR